MELFNIFFEVMVQEKRRFNLDDNKLIPCISALTPTLTESFDVPYNRCAYMYRYATVNTYFVKNCISKFLCDYPEATDLLTLWRSHSDLALCSLSCGPGLDYLSFVLAVSELEETPDIFNNVNIISKNGSWRMTVNLLSESLAKAELSSLAPKGLSFQNIKVIQSDIKKGFRADMIDILRSSEVVLMVKTLNLSAPVSEDEEECLLSNFDALISSLRPEATIFFIDTKPSVSLMLKALPKSSGKFLYGPIHVPYIHPVPFPEIYREKYTIFPVASARGTFLVWQKFPFDLLPDLPFPPEGIQTMKLERENVDVSSVVTEFPMSGLFPHAVAEVSSFINDRKSQNNSILSTSGEYQLSNISPSPYQLSDTKMNLLVTQEESTSSNLKSKSYTSTSSSHSDILDSLLTEILNSPPTIKPSTSKEMEGFESVHDAVEKFNNSFSVAGSSHTDSGVCEKTESPTDWVNSRACSDFSPLNFSPWCNKVASTEQSSSLSSNSKNSKKHEVIQNLIDGKYASLVQSSLESIPTQTDPNAEMKPTNHSDSIKCLTDRINKLINSFEKELAQEKNSCRHHGTHFHCCHNCSCFNTLVHCCTSHSRNCDNACSKEDGKSLFKSDNLTEPSDSDKTVRCDHCRSATCCSGPVQGQCCHRQDSMQGPLSSGALCVNSPVNVAVPSLVIPLQNISMDVLSQLLSDVKINIKSS